MTATSQLVNKAKAVLLLCLFTLQGSLIAASSVDKNITQSLDLLSRYLNSNTARTIEDGEQQTAKLLLKRATSKTQQANESLDLGDIDLARQQINEAMEAYGEAGRVFRTGSTGASQIVQQNNNIRQEIDAYKTAYEQAVTDKGPGASGILNSGQFNDLMNESLALEQSGDPMGAQADLRSAYNMLVTALIRVRENETVVYSLDFRTPADEYRYELKRYDSYSMLVTQREQEAQPGNKSASKMASDYKNRAAGLAEAAETQAQSGDHEQAIKSMEQANQNLVRALRSMGLIIPG